MSIQTRTPFKQQHKTKSLVKIDDVTRDEKTTTTEKTVSSKKKHSLSKDKKCQELDEIQEQQNPLVVTKQVRKKTCRNNICLSSNEIETLTPAEKSSSFSLTAIVPLENQALARPTLKKSKPTVSVEEIEELASNCVIPEHFYEVWNGLLEMRSTRNAPVDLMGCGKLGELAPDPKLKRFHHLVACFLSSQTSDQCTAVCMERLRTYGLTVDHIKSTEEEDLASILRGVSFHNRKAKNLKTICGILLENYNGDIPQTYNELSSLPGIGPKMALIIMSSAWGKVEGIAVDVHVHRITNRSLYHDRLGWIKTKTPEETCLALAKTVPRDLWREFNEVLVGFGQQRCKAIRPMCATCLVRGYCPSASPVPKTLSLADQAFENSFK